MKPICTNCRYFAGIGDAGDNVGECQRFPPLPVLLTQGESDRSVFPIVRVGDTCGEFSPGCTLKG